MFNNSEPIFLHCLSPLHVGSGNDLGYIDLPIQRERHTEYPKIEASGLKGSMREYFESLCKNTEDKIKVHVVFGYDAKADKDIEEVHNPFKADKDKFSGALGFTDARCLLFPVRSVKGAFAYITSPFALKRFKQDLESAGNWNENISIPPKNTIAKGSQIDINNNVILEEYSYSVTQNDKCTELANWLGKIIFPVPNNDFNLAEKLVILDDTDFKAFVKLATEKITRTKIDNETGTVAKGALFNEEYLPSETIMYSIVLFSPFYSGAVQEWGKNKDSELLRSYFRDTFSSNGSKLPIMQIGGNATLGKGLTRVQLI